MAQASKNILWLTTSRIAALVMLFFGYTQLFRYLGPVGTGQQQFILSYVTIFGVIVDFGIQNYIVKKISESPEDAKKYFHNFFAVEVLLTSTIFVIMMSIAWTQVSEASVLYGILVAGLGMTIHGLSTPFLAVMSAFQDLRKVALLNFLSSVVNVAFIFATIIFHKWVVFLVGNQLVFAILSFLFYYRFIKAHIPKPDLIKAIGSLDVQLVKKILVAALPFALLAGFSTIYNRIDVLLITHLLGFSNTGLYTAAYKFYDLVAFFPAVVSHSLYPVFAGFIARKELLLARTVFEKYLRFMLAVAIPMGVGASILASKIMSILAGQEFSGSATVLSILVWAPVALFIYIVANAVVISQLTKFAVAITGLNVAINIVGNIILLPRVGIVGAAAMTVVSELLQGFFYFYFVRKKIIQFSFFKYLWQPLLASIFMGVCIWSLRGYFIVIPVVIGGISYLVALYMLGFISKEDIAFAKAIVKKSPIV